MSEQQIRIECPACKATGLYVGMAERNGAAVVCSRCKGTGATTISFTPFTARYERKDVASVHVTRGYVVAPESGGGIPIAEWEPGKAVPADEDYYCPYLYTYQEWCAKGEAPLHLGQSITQCPIWPDKAGCWAAFHASSHVPLVVV